DQPRSREPPRRERTRLAKTKGAPGRGRRGGVSTGLSRSHLRLKPDTTLMLKKILWFVAILFVLAGVGAIVGGNWLRDRVDEPYRGYTDETFVEIAPGANTRAIGQRLIASGVVRDDLTFRAAVWLSGNGTKLKAGEYHFDQPLSATQVVDKLA